MRVSPYSEQDAARWDDFAARAPMATLLHTRRFLSYHGERFRDVSALVEDDRHGLVGLFPAAADPSDARRVVSHPGITFGGLLHDGRLYGEAVIEALDCLRTHYAGLGFERLRYKAVPHIYQRTPACDDLYALFRAGAVRYRCDLSCAIDLAARGTTSSRRRRGLRKASAAGVRVEEGAHHAAALWVVLEENLRRKYGVSPVHTLEEITLLHSRFPDAVRFFAGLLGEELVAGVVLFDTPRTARVQYVASGEVGYNLSALDAVFEHCIAAAAARGAGYFDFGASNEDEGRRLNVGLYQFKSEFGGGGVAYESYELKL